MNTLQSLTLHTIYPNEYERFRNGGTGKIFPLDPESNAHYYGHGFMDGFEGISGLFMYIFSLSFDIVLFNI